MSDEGVNKSMGMRPYKEEEQQNKRKVRSQAENSISFSSVPSGAKCNKKKHQVLEQRHLKQPT